MRSRRRLLAALTALPVLAAWPQSAGAAVKRQPGERGVRVLMVTATAGYYHDSIPTARRVVRDMTARVGWTVDLLEGVGDLGRLSAATLAEHDVLFFANTSGELPLDDGQKAAILEFVARGGGFVGTHSATDTLYEWSGYGDLVGAYFQSHPWVQPVNVVVENGEHPATEGLGTSFAIAEEIYTFRTNPRDGVRVLLRLDETSVGSRGDYPLAWSKAYGAGRVYYNALGHFAETWEDPRFQAQLVGALAWSGGSG